MNLLEKSEETYSSYHLAVIRLNNKEPLHHKSLFEKMRENNIGVQLHYQPIHLNPYYRNLGFKNGDFPNAELYGQNAFSIPLFPSLSEEEQNFVVSVLQDFY